MILRINRIKAILVLFVLAAGVLCNSCQKDEEEKTAVLNSWGPSPALRGGELKFIGSNLDQVNAVVLPPNIEVTTFVTKTPGLLVIQIPEETMPGQVTLKTTKGATLTPLTRLAISEPITITTIAPAKVRPGGTITISGTYLNLIKEVIFTNRKVVTIFESQSKTQLVVKVPMDAQTGIVTLSNGAAEPLLVESATPLEVNHPVVTAVSPTPVKAGAVLTLTGTDLDLVKSILFPGNTKVETFITKVAGSITLTVPNNAQDGKLKLTALSLVETEVSTPITMVVPAITAISPNPAKNGGELTITGTDLDLATEVLFGGGKKGTITSKAATQLKVTIPLDATADKVTVSAASGKSAVSAATLALTMPVVTSFDPAAVKTNSEITITGTDLDLVTRIIFSQNLSVNVTGATATAIVIKVPSGAVTGKFTMVTTNNTQVQSPGDLTILASNVPVITSMPASVKPGEILTIQGEKLDLFTDVIFPAGVYATTFGKKTANLLEVFVPLNVKPGKGKITFITIDNETTESPDIVITAADPVQDWSLVFFDFDGTGSKDSWWGAVQLENLPELTLNGTKYGRLNGSYNGWTDLFWRNGKNNFPGATVGTKVNEYVIKFDINVLEPVTGGNIKLRLEGEEGDFWWAYGPAAPPNAGIPGVIAVTNGWVSVTVPISQFKDGWGWGSNSPSDMAKVVTFGAAFDNGSSKVNVCIDNVRFEKK